MPKKSIIILSLLVISCFTASYTSVTAISGELLDFTFSDKISVGSELSWQLTKFDVSPVSEIESFEWKVTTGHALQEGDLFKIIITTDPDTLNLTDFAEIFYTNLEWAEFYINDDLLTTNATDVSWGGFGESNLITLYILPVTIESSIGGVENTFEALNEEFESFEYSDSSGKYEVTLNDNSFVIKAEKHASGSFAFGGSFSYDSYVEIAYDTNWGILSKLDIESKMKEGSVSTSAHWVLESAVEGVIIPAPFNLFYGMIGILILGLAYVAKRK